LVFVRSSQMITMQVVVAEPFACGL